MAKTKPKQSQLKPKQSQFKPNLSSVFYFLRSGLFNLLQNS
jgi:hypothetical protein